MVTKTNKQLIDEYLEIKKDCIEAGIFNLEEIKNLTELKIKLLCGGLF